MAQSLETIDGTDFDLLRAVQARLCASVPKLAPGICMICDEPVPPGTYFPRGDLACTIALSDGTFDTEKYDGAGANQLCERKSLIVTVFTRSKLDQPPRAEFALLDEQRGILTCYKPAILRALLIHDPTAETLEPWQPLRGEHPILRGALVPTRSQGPRQLLDDDWLGLSLFFDVEFDWELRTPVEE